MSIVDEDIYSRKSQERITSSIRDKTERGIEDKAEDT
jgi:hypothetical protein